jgi:signal transduction histidine kinase
LCWPYGHTTMDGMNSVVSWPLRRLRDVGWGVLLVPVALLSVVSIGWGVRLELVGLVAAAVVLLVPVVAADLAAAGVAGLGLYVTVVTWWMALSFFHLLGNPFYHGFGLTGPNPVANVFVTGSGAGVALDVVMSTLILGFAVWLVPRTIGVHAGLVRRNVALASRVTRLAETRVMALDTAAAELRRVERDLHDGAQARLVTLGINLRAAEELFRTDPDAALTLVAESRENSALALAELRALVRGIHPPVLADRGLADAIRALALSSPVPAETDIELPGRPPAPVETAVYFAVAEALANVVKHAGANHVHIRIAHSSGTHSSGTHGDRTHSWGMLRIEVTDDGHGGADPANGTGLLGVERRVSTFDGILAVSSPAGGPTIIVIEVPCALSSPKTSSS